MNVEREGFQTPRVWGEGWSGPSGGKFPFSDPTRVGRGCVAHRAIMDIHFSDPTRVGRGYFRHKHRNNLLFQTPRVWGEAVPAASTRPHSPFRPHACGERRPGTCVPGHGIDSFACQP